MKPVDWVEPERYYRSLPKKRSGVGVLFFNTSDQILFLKPTYAEHLNLPGGAVNELESPKQAGIREVEEELRLRITELSLLCVDYLTEEGVRTEGYHFVFDGGVLLPESIAQIVTDGKEIEEMMFLDAQVGVPRLSSTGAKRTANCLVARERHGVCYLENGNLT